MSPSVSLPHGQSSRPSPKSGPGGPRSRHSRRRRSAVRVGCSPIPLPHRCPRHSRGIPARHDRACLSALSGRAPAFPAEDVKAITLAVAFLFWSANQFWPDLPQATVFNDIAIGLFVLDLFLVIVGWPAASGDESFGESAGRTQCCPACAARQMGDRNPPSSTTHGQASSL